MFTENVFTFRRMRYNKVITVEVFTFQLDLLDLFHVIDFENCQMDEKKRRKLKK